MRDFFPPRGDRSRPILPRGASLGLAALLVAGLAACGRSAEPAPAAAAPVAPEAPPPASPPAPAAAPATPVEKIPTVVFLGDSLTAGFGLEKDQAFPTLVEQMLAEEGTPIKAINAGISGDTTAGGLSRIDWLLRQKPDVVVVGLGGNDGLRGLDLAGSEANLTRIVAKAKAAGSRVLLLGMVIPPNYGPDYTSGFAAMYPRVAEKEQVALLPFLLEGVGGIAKLNQADGIHPTVEGQRIVARTVAAALRPILSDGAAAVPNQP